MLTYSNTRTPAKCKIGVFWDNNLWSEASKPRKEYSFVEAILGVGCITHFNKSNTFGNFEISLKSHQLVLLISC